MTEPFKGLALGVFLITVGMTLDLQFIASHWPMLILATVGVLAVKALVTWGLLRLARMPHGLPAQAGLLMASPSETTLIVLAAAQGARLIAPETASFWQVVTAIGLTATPLLARLGSDDAKLIERGSMNGIEIADHEMGQDRTVIIGFGRVGRMVAQMLRRHEKPFIAIDADANTVRRAREEGYPVVFGDIARPGFMEKLDLGGANVVVLKIGRAHV